MKIVVASDSFKGSLDSDVIGEIVKKVNEMGKYGHEILPLFVADGGDGTLGAVASATGARFETFTVKDPLFRDVTARIGVSSDSAVIATCEASGLALLKKEERNVMHTTSFGTGELIKRALALGKKRIYLALGGSAMQDGGIGAMTELGFRFLKKDGTYAKGVGEELIDVVKIEDDGVKIPKDVKFTVLSDVQNPTVGDKGSCRIFAKQKGASESQIEELEAGMRSFCKLLYAYCGINVENLPGGGAAGGLGACLFSLLGAEIESGAERVLSLCRFDEVIKDADLIVTGEGRMDAQSKDGKLMACVLSHAKRQNKKTVALVGCLGPGYEEMFSLGLSEVFPLVNETTSPAAALANASLLLAERADALLRRFAAT